MTRLLHSIPQLKTNDLKQVIYIVTCATREAVSRPPIFHTPPVKEEDDSDSLQPEGIQTHAGDTQYRDGSQARGLEEAKFPRFLYE